VIHFFTLKGLKATAIHTELESVSGQKEFAVLTVKKGPRGFHQGKKGLFDSLRWERPLANDLTGAIGLLLEERLFSSCKVLCRHFWVEKAICLRILHNKLGLKSSIFSKCRMPYRSTRRAKVCPIRNSFPSDGIDETNSEQLSKDYHRG
jgi:hypothetical protein